jgi:thymidine kinase
MLPIKIMPNLINISPKQASLCITASEATICDKAPIDGSFAYFLWVLRGGAFLRCRSASQSRMAKLYFHYATMNAGKSTMLLQASYNYRERGMRTAIFIADFDHRGGQGRVASRIGLSSDAIPFSPEDDLYAEISKLHGQEPLTCVFIDEAQFLTSEQVWQLARITDRVGIPVMAYGLRTDFRGKLFPGSQELLAIADELREVRTICHCGRKATMVVRVDADGEALREGAQVEVGGNDRYVSLCRRHWEEKMRCW